MWYSILAFGREISLKVFIKFSNWITVTLRNFKDKNNQLIKLYIKATIIVYEGVLLLEKLSFESNSTALSLSLLFREGRLHLRYESS